MNGWVGSLTPGERAEWDEYVRHCEEELVPKMRSSAFVVSLVPDGKPDIKFSMELGMAVMLGKPIIAVCIPPCVIPEKLAAVADCIVEADISTEEGQAALMHAMIAMMEQLTGEPTGLYDNE